MTFLLGLPLERRSAPSAMARESNVSAEAAVRLRSKERTPAAVLENIGDGLFVGCAGAGIPAFAVSGAHARDV
jgi:hypothetical protein